MSIILVFGFTFDSTKSCACCAALNSCRVLESNEQSCEHYETTILVGMDGHARREDELSIQFRVCLSVCLFAAFPVSSSRWMRWFSLVHRLREEIRTAVHIKINQTPIQYIESNK